MKSKFMDLKKRFLCVCLQCGHKWLSKTDAPIRCPAPKCTNPYYWQFEKKGD